MAEYSKQYCEIWDPEWPHDFDIEKIANTLKPDYYKSFICEGFGFTAIGKVDIGLMGVFLVLNTSIISSANFIVTYRYLSTLNNRKRRDARAFFTEGILVTS